MKQLYGDDFKRVFADGTNLLTIEDEMFYLYCLRCGGIKLFHLFVENQPETHRLVHRIEKDRLCYCHRPHIREKGSAQVALANVFVGLGKCKTVEDVRLMIEEMASREEMRDGERQAL